MAVRFGDCELDVDCFELRRGGSPIPLEPRAMHLLVHLIEHRDQVVTKGDLLDAVWGDRFVSESALTTQIKALRRAVGDNGREQSVIKTVHGLGYRFLADIDADEADATDGSMPGDADPSDHPVIAVLPFANLSGDHGRDHVAEGLTSDVITALAKHRWLRVLARATTAAYATQPDSIAGLREDLGVTYAVEGTVRADDQRLRVTVTLTDTVSGACRWAERYDRRIEDLFDVLDEVTDLVVSTIEPVVGTVERDRIATRPRTDLRAWDLFHLGIGHFYRFTAEDNLEAQHLLARARELDPDFADAHAWWAYAVVLGMTYWGTDPDADLLQEALDATTTALEADDHNAVFHMLRGRVQLARREYGAALRENERAIALNPTFAAAFCGMGDSLCYEGRYDEALAQFSRSVELGSRDPQRWAFLTYGALALIFAGRYDEAVRWADRASSIPNCQYWTTSHKVVALALSGREDECVEPLARLREQCPEFSVDYARRKLFYLKRPEQREQYLEGLARAGVPER